MKLVSLLGWIWVLQTSLPMVVQAETITYAPIDTLDLNAYTGRWFQMYSNLGFILLSLGGNCVTADYTLRPSDGKIALRNQARPFPFFPSFLSGTTGFVAPDPTGASPEGALTVDQGYIVPFDPDDVNFEAPGNYWVIGIGPIVNGQYQWAAVSNSDRSLSFIIARDVGTFRASYEADALAVFADDGGFGSFFTNKPLPTSHLFCFGYP